jgi:hypothetical protein
LFSYPLKTRIATMTEKGFTILVGDANCADKAVQRYLAEKRYQNVIVHCMTANCRNNVGEWPTQENCGASKGRAASYTYSIKDQAMVDAAEYGLMLWDGQSKGTLNSAINMVRQDKPIVVYLAPKKIFRNLRSWRDLDDLLNTCDRATVQRFEGELAIEYVRQRALLL